MNAADSLLIESVSRHTTLDGMDGKKEHTN
jgi:hypothetical protein